MPVNKEYLVQSKFTKPHYCQMSSKSDAFHQSNLLSVAELSVPEHLLNRAALWL